MLTADTHFPDGYLCKDCENKWDEQYKDVISCSSKKVEISHTLAAMHLDPLISSSALRLSFSHLTTKEELDAFLDALKDTLNRIKKQR